MPCKGSMRNFDFCLKTVKRKQGYDQSTAEAVCGKIRANIGKDEHELKAPQQKPVSEWTSLKKMKISSQLKEGTKAEGEHAKTLESIGIPKEKITEAQKKIAQDHLTEQPDYYARLEEMEAPDFWSRLKTRPSISVRNPEIRKSDMKNTDTDETDEKEIKDLRLKSKLSPSKHDLKEVHEEITKQNFEKEWDLNIEEILKSDREFEGTFHKPVIDRENDIIPATAMDKAMDDFMVLPTLQEVHTERTVGLIVKAWKTSDDEYKFKGKIKPGDDCNDVWDKIVKGQYDGLSIGGRRIRYSKDCSIPSSIRTTPCVTHKLKLYNVSVCSSPVNPEATVESVSKAEDDNLVFDLTETLIKAKPTELNSIRKGEENMDEQNTEVVSKSDEDPEVITKSDIAELTKAVTDLNKSFGRYFSSLTTPQPQHLGGKKARHATSTLHKDEDPDPDPDEDPEPKRRVRKDEDPDPDPDEDPEPKRRVRKAEDEPGINGIEDLRKSFDDVITERDEYIAALEERVAKMEEQTIRKGGTAVVIPDQLDANDPLLKNMSNLDVLAGRITK